MKQNLTLLVLILGANLLAQTPKLTKECNIYRPGDIIVKQQVEFKDPGPSGRNITWDFSMLNPVDEEYKIRYMFRLKNDSTRIVANEHHTSYRYQLKGDTLWLYEFQNRTTKMTFSKPEAQLKFPFNYGDVLLSEFEGTGKYSETIDLTAKGKTHATIDGIGQLITPTLQKISNVLRVHRVREYTEIGIDSALLKLETYSWYAANLRYPVFETFISYIIKPDSTYEDFKTSFYYPLDDSYNQGANDYIIPEIEKVFTEATMLPNPVVSDMNINYKLTRPAVVWFSIHNNAGIPVQQTTAQNMSEGYNHCNIPMSNLMTGTYTVYVHVDDMIMQRVILKK